MIKRIINHTKWRLNRLKEIDYPQWNFSRQLPKVVHSGPFEGMKYLSNSVGSVVLPKLVGTYEDELHPALLDLKNTPYDLFLDVGAAEGFYAVGIKRYLLPAACCVVFEAREKGRKMIDRLAALNGVSGITIHGYCSPEKLAKQLGSRRSFILMDVEGFEYTLLNPKEVDFSKADILVEIHQVKDVDAAVKLEESFAESHTIEKIKTAHSKQLPKHKDFHATILKNEQYVVNEFRSGSVEWYLMKVRN